MSARKLNHVYKVGLWVIVGVLMVLMLSMSVSQNLRYMNPLLTGALVVTVLWVVVFSVLRAMSRRESRQGTSRPQDVGANGTRKG